ncbi:MAG: OmpA family protein [Bacteroidales bacterium]|nr:OmpA family protein [Bacteroidales bacterium]
MKRQLLFLALFALALTGVQAQQQEETKFKPHWYVQPQAGISWTTGEAKFSKLLSPAAQLSVGRQFSPLFGLRLGASGWQGRNWQVTPAEEYKWKHVQASLDATLSLSNAFGGYNPDRRWNAYAFLGGGLNVAFDNDDANVLAAGHPVEFSKVWDGTYYSPAVRGGLGVEYALSERVALGLEANVNMLPDKWNSKHGTDADWQSHLLVGVRIALGKTSQRTIVEPVTIIEPVVESVVEPEPEPVVEETKTVVEEQPIVSQPVEEAPTTAAAAVAEEPAPVVEQPAAETKDEVKIYFAFNSSRISKLEAAKLRQVANYMRSHRDMRLTIEGYASPEGRSDYNMCLSGWRATAVKECLVSYGVAASRIDTEAKGEVELGDAKESRSAICITIE